jgi:hypothetical protein
MYRQMQRCAEIFHLLQIERHRRQLTDRIEISAIQSKGLYFMRNQSLDIVSIVADIRTELPAAN